MAEELLDVDDLSRVLKISRSSIYRRRSLGEPLPPAIRIGKNLLRWKASDVEKFIDEHREPVGGQ